MSTIEILSLIVTIVCLFSFCTVFTVLFRSYFKNGINNVEEGKEDIALIDQAVIEEESKKKKNKIVLSIVGKSISIFLFIIILAFFTFSLINRISGNNLMINDTSIMVVASGSMSEKNEENDYLFENDLNNQIQTYDIILVNKVNEPSDIDLYDIIAFESDDGKTIIHRVVSIDIINGEYRYITHGDANRENQRDEGSLYDSYLTYDKIIGKYQNKRLPLIGIFVIFLQSATGIITVVSIIYCFLMFDYYKSKYEKAIQERTNILIDLIDSDMDDSDIHNNFKQELIYKGYRYTFVNGNFESKEQLEGTNDKMTIISEKNNAVTKVERNISNKNEKN